MEHGGVAGTVASDGSMNLTCPNCQTRYKVKPQALGARGRKVRCATCGHKWLATPDGAAQPSGLEPQPELGAGAKLEPKPGPVAEAPASDGARAYEIIDPSPKATPPPARKRSALGPILSWLAVLLVALAVVGAIVGRGAILQAFPQAAWLYSRLGLSVTVPTDLDLRGINAQEGVEDAVRYLFVTAEIHNPTGGERAVPPLEVTIFDAERAVLRQERIRPPQDRLSPGGMVVVRGRVALPEADAASYIITFAPLPAGDAAP